MALLLASVAALVFLWTSSSGPISPTGPLPAGPPSADPLPPLPGLAASTVPEEKTPDLVVADEKPRVHVPGTASIRGRILGADRLRGEVSLLARWYGLPEGRWVGTEVEGPDGTTLHGIVFTTVDEDGRYVLEGLAPGPWRVTVRAPNWGTSVHPDVTDAAERLVRAPAEGVDFDVSRSLLRFEVAGSTPTGPSPSTMATVDLEGEVEVRLAANGLGRAAIVVPVERKVTYRVTEPGSRTERRTVVTGVNGETRDVSVVLENSEEEREEAVVPRDDGQRVFLEVLGPDGRGVTTRCAVVGADGAARAVRFFDADVDRPGLLSFSSARTLAHGGAWTVYLPAGEHFRFDFEADGYERVSKQLTVSASGRGDVVQVRLVPR